MKKPTRRELIKLDILRGLLTDDQIKQKYFTDSKTLKECRIELKESNSFLIS